MANNERFTATIEVNAKQAHSELNRLTSEYNSKMARLKALSTQRSNEARLETQQLRKETKDLSRQIREQKKYVDGLDRAVGGLAGKSYKDLKNEIKQVQRIMRDGTVENGSTEWNDLAQHVRRCKNEMKEYERAVAPTTSMWGKMTGFLNQNFGAFVQIIGAVSGLSMTIRKSVQDYAQMEEAMADTRKYTGLSMEGVRELNDELKKMDTRTAREELNALAGAAGRLGITSKEGLLEFVDAADKIKIALGDDLGENAVDQIGKLAMAFGEDDRLGLRGAMLATGSAVNELAQNSAANAGYLVEFTARVAGVGKQLGLTQAQIMGFGAVMDENLLKDEMSSTAFSQLITKMATNAEKFAKFAGMETSKFVKLVKEDLNGAILALADNMKKQDPSTMLKMFGDMGLDGTRAVGVLSNMADKIDDVRRHQQTATEAYKEGTSVISEFNVMNNTAQAQLDKAKNKFHEMSVELGERLKPVVAYTITSASLLMKALSVLTTFVFQNKNAIVALSAAIAINTAIYKAHAIQVAVVSKLEAANTLLLRGKTLLLNTLKAAYIAYNIVIAAVSGNYQRLNVLMRANNILVKTNPWGALATVLLTVVAATYTAISAISKHNAALRENQFETQKLRALQKLQADINKQVSDSTSEQKTRIEQLTRIIRSNVYSVNERRAAVRALQKIVPNYHASISKEGKLYKENSKAIQDYVTDLETAAYAEVLYQKKVEINKKKLELQFKKNRVQGSLNAVESYRGTQAQTENYEWVDQDGRVHSGTRKTKSAKESDRQRKIHEGRMANLGKQEALLDSEEKFVDEQIKKDKRIQQRINDKIKGNNTQTISTTPSGGGGGGGSETEAERKKREEEEKKREAEEKRREAEAKRKLKQRADAAKAMYDSEIAEEMYSYMKGEIGYDDYLKNKHDKAERYYNQLKKIYGADSDEYKKVLDDRAKEEQDYERDKAAWTDKKLTQERLEKERSIRRQYMQQNVIDDEGLNEALFQNEIDYLRKKQTLYETDPKKWEEIEMEIRQKTDEEKFRKEQHYLDMLSKLREEAGHKDYDSLLEMELKGIESIYEMLKASGQMTQAEYDAIVQSIKKKYAGLKAEAKASADVAESASKALDTAKKNAGAKDVGTGDNLFTGIGSIAQSLEQQKKVNEELKRLYGEDYENNKEYQEAKRQLDRETFGNIVAGAEAAYSTISTFMSAASSYAQACSDLEVAKITANYDKQIEAAGKNSKKKERLEKERDEAIRKEKTKSSKRAMKIEMAQAVASSAVNALHAFGAVLQPSMPWTVPLAYAAAGAALAAGAIQIATIKKQHEAEMMGYYDGGFTGGRRYRKEAGVVHEGEFVANHEAVNNRQLAPVLSLIDEAQRNNRVGSLRAEDVRNIMGGAPTLRMVTPVVNVENNNEELRETLGLVADTQRQLAEEIQKGIGVDIPIDGDNGIYKKLRQYESLIKSK